MGLHGYRHALVSMVTFPSPLQELDICEISKDFFFSLSRQPAQKSRVRRSEMKVSVTSWEGKGEMVIIFATVAIYH